MTNLDALIAEVEAGAFDGVPHKYNAFARKWEAAFGAYFEPNFTGPSSAYNGSLDAAKALHDALLPGWRVEVFNLDGEVVLRRNRPIDRAYGNAMNSGEVARAWLLAILRAYRATMEEAQ